ncbi:hypothetical protein GCM10025865_30120 [Paraoerskovia sediminicola]|uniref:GIY-YIG domain-containing protein n=1 Tax=Paraoerskovia sediminicola TaxID=1138587 RepID=A0ABM8G6C3_9CELL|nr:hypothetical protein GCM10025865_30120 [Paraoerskovia sediminicola]
MAEDTSTSDAAGPQGFGTRIEHFAFDRASIDGWHDPEDKHRSWPVVYTLNNERQVYVGESMNALGRMHQHLDSGTKSGLRAVRIMVNDEFNKSACLDLESYLIRLFSGDGGLQVLNRNAGVVDANYFDRARYQKTFEEIFEQLREEGLFDKRIAQIENSDLFKLSPFKALNDDQAIAIEDIVEGLLEDLEAGQTSTAVIEGGPGTGKTIVAIYLLKLLTDIRERNDHDNPDAELLFSDFFVAGNAELLQGRRLGLVVPQQSLRASVQKVFAKTPGLSRKMVLSPRTSPMPRKRSTYSSSTRHIGSRSTDPRPTAPCSTGSERSTRHSPGTARTGSSSHRSTGSSARVATRCSSSTKARAFGRSTYRARCSVRYAPERSRRSGTTR